MKMRFNIKTDVQRDAAIAQIKNQVLPENGLTITVTEFKNNRSLAQNRLLFGHVYPPIIEQMSEATGAYVTKDQMHEFFKGMFSPRICTKVLGEEVYTVKSTTKFTKAEFSEYIEKIYSWGAKRGVWWPV